MRFGTRLVSAISGASTLWGFMPAAWQTAVMGTMTLVTGYFGFQTGGVFYALIGASAVFAFVMFGIFLMTLMTKMVSSYEKLAVEQVGLFNPILDHVKDGRNRKVWTLKNLTFEITVRNHSQQTLYFKIRRAAHSMAGNTIRGEHKLPDIINIVPAMTAQKVILQTLPDIPIANGMEGVIDLEIAYGDERESLKYLLIYGCTPQLSIILQKNGSGQIAMSTPIVKNVHETFK
jgi:hypothetical protein